jgi:hypothetical protein
VTDVVVQVDIFRYNKRSDNVSFDLGHETIVSGARIDCAVIKSIVELLRFFKSSNKVLRAFKILRSHPGDSHILMVK